jgi:hypothetical protein
MTQPYPSPGGEARSQFEYNLPATTSAYQEGYMREFERRAGADLDFANPELQRMLDLPLFSVVKVLDGERYRRLERILTPVDLCLRDVFVLGSNQATSEIRDVGGKRGEHLRHAIQAFFPNLPLMDDVAPPAVARQFYPRIGQVPLFMRGNQKITVERLGGDMWDMRGYYQTYIQLLEIANSEGSTMIRQAGQESPPEPATGADPMAIALKALRKGFQSGAQDT